MKIPFNYLVMPVMHAYLCVTKRKVTTLCINKYFLQKMNFIEETEDNFFDGFDDGIIKEIELLTPPASAKSISKTRTNVLGTAYTKFSNINPLVTSSNFLGRIVRIFEAKKFTTKAGLTSLYQTVLLKDTNNIVVCKIWNTEGTLETINVFNALRVLFPSIINKLPAWHFSKCE